MSKNKGHFNNGNNFWEQRAKHGRDKLFADANKMRDAACEYFQWCVDNPWKKEQAMSIDKELVIAELCIQRPFTMQGLCNFIGCNTAYFRQFKADKIKCTADFSAVIEWIEDTIYQQKFEGATVGVFNANIISRDLGLVDKSETKVDVITVEQPED